MVIVFSIGIRCCRHENVLKLLIATHYVDISLPDMVSFSGYDLKIDVKINGHMRSFVSRFFHNHSKNVYAVCVNSLCPFVCLSVDRIYTVYILA